MPMPALSGRPLLDTRADAQLFRGREKELDALARSIRQRFNTLLLGARGSGKTSLMRLALLRLRESEETAVWVDGRAARTADELLRAVAIALDKAVSAGRENVLRKPRIGFARADLEAAIEASALATLLEALHALVDRLPEGGRAVVFVDEVLDPEIAHTVFGRLRDELWTLDVTWVVGADEAARSSYLRPPADAFFESIIVLPALTDADAEALLDARGARDAAARAIVAAAGGNPRRVLELARAASRGESEEMIRARGRLPELVAAAFGTLAGRLVAEIATVGPVSAGDSRLRDAFDVTPTRVGEVLRRLEAAGVLTAATEPGDGPGRPRRVYMLAEGPLDLAALEAPVDRAVVTARERGRDDHNSEHLDAELVERMYAESHENHRALLRALAAHSGQWISTGELASELGKANGARAVAGMMGAFGRRAANRYEGRKPWRSRWDPLVEESRHTMDETTAGVIRQLAST